MHSFKVLTKTHCIYSLFLIENCIYSIYWLEEGAGQKAMLSIPFIETYFNKVVGKERPISDSVDRLNHYGTALLLAIFAIGISTKQYFGNAINCWTPNEFKGCLFC